MIPKSWGPQRNQPHWDRTYATHEELQASWAAKDDRAQQWAKEAVAFSNLILGAIPTEERRQMAARARHEVDKHQRKNGLH